MAHVAVTPRDPVMATTLKFPMTARSTVEAAIGPSTSRVVATSRQSQPPMAGFSRPLTIAKMGSPTPGLCLPSARTGGLRTARSLHTTRQTARTARISPPPPLSQLALPFAEQPALLTARPSSAVPSSPSAFRVHGGDSPTSLATARKHRAPVVVCPVLPGDLEKFSSQKFVQRAAELHQQAEELVERSHKIVDQLCQDQIYFRNMKRAASGAATFRATTPQENEDGQDAADISEEVLAELRVSVPEAAMLFAEKDSQPQSLLESAPMSMSFDLEDDGAPVTSFQLLTRPSNYDTIVELCQESNFDPEASGRSEGDERGDPELDALIFGSPGSDASELDPDDETENEWILQRLMSMSNISIPSSSNSTTPTKRATPLSSFARRKFMMEKRATLMGRLASRLSSMKKRASTTATIDPLTKEPTGENEEQSAELPSLSKAPTLATLNLDDSLSRSSTGSPQQQLLAKRLMSRKSLGRSVQFDISSDAGIGTGDAEEELETDDDGEGDGDLDGAFSSMMSVMTTQSSLASPSSAGSAVSSPSASSSPANRRVASMRKASFAVMQSDQEAGKPSLTRKASYMYVVPQSVPDAPDLDQLCEDLFAIMTEPERTRFGDLMPLQLENFFLRVRCDRMEHAIESRQRRLVAQADECAQAQLDCLQLQIEVKRMKMQQQHWHKATKEMVKVRNEVRRLQFEKKYIFGKLIAELTNEPMPHPASLTGANPALAMLTARGGKRSARGPSKDGVREIQKVENSRKAAAKEKAARQEAKKKYLKCRRAMAPVMRKIELELMAETDEFLDYHAKDCGVDLESVAKQDPRQSQEASIGNNPNHFMLAGRSGVQLLWDGGLGMATKGIDVLFRGSGALISGCMDAVRTLTKHVAMIVVQSIEASNEVSLAAMDFGMHFDWKTMLSVGMWRLQRRAERFIYGRTVGLMRAMQAELNRLYV